MGGEQLLTVAQVAERLQAHPETVRRWLRAGKLRGSKVGGSRLGYRISEGELERFLRVDGRAGGETPDLPEDAWAYTPEHLEQVARAREQVRTGELLAPSVRDLEEVAVIAGA
jgi:excisionase family DNA binding protein